MSIGYFKEGLTTYFLEARREDGTCVYRKYTGDDSFRQRFELVPPTKCGVHFRAVSISKEEHKRYNLIADPAVSRYLMRQIGRIMGRSKSPEKVNNERVMAQFNKNGHVHRTDSNRQRILDGILKEPVDPETIEGELLASYDVFKKITPARLAALSAGNSFAWEEGVQEEGFDVEAWAAGEVDAGGERGSGMPILQSGGISPADDAQSAVKGPKETRGDRIARTKAGK